jgi:hypothetical protein
MKNTEVVYSATESSVQEYKQDNLESGSPTPFSCLDRKNNQPYVNCPLQEEAEV